MHSLLMSILCCLHLHSHKNRELLESLVGQERAAEKDLGGEGHQEVSRLLPVLFSVGDIVVADITRKQRFNYCWGQYGCVFNLKGMELHSCHNDRTETLYINCTIMMPY